MPKFYKQDNTLFLEAGREFLRIQPWGKSTLRVRITRGHLIPDKPDVLIKSSGAVAKIEISDDAAVITNEKIRAEVASDGQIKFCRTCGDKILLETLPSLSCHLKPTSGRLFRAQVDFKAYDDERIYGLGQHKDGFLNQKGCVIDLTHENTEVSIPFLLSSRDYGFLWHNPAIGRVELGNNRTRWVANSTSQIDYLVMTGESPAEIMECYADATGYPPLLPEWAAGFWQSKLLYKTQEELLSVANEYKRRELPLSVIVIDYFHYKNMGDWKLDPERWPDPTEMVRQLEKMGIKVMVSVWPTVTEDSENFQQMSEDGLLVDTEKGLPILRRLSDDGPQKKMHLYYYDPTNPEARKFVWEKVCENYYRHGIKIWWLDACEPDILPLDHDNLRYAIGNGEEVGCIYPLMNQQTFYDGMKSQGEEDIVMLSRSAWAGSQRYGAAVWSGDIYSTFESLQNQVRAGLNMAMSGIYWWTTDIGGFEGGDINSDYFRELIVRWFQYGAFCPLFRLHGYREPVKPDSGAANEVWSFGDEAYQIIKDVLLMRERMRPYIMKQMEIAHKKGIPLMRPLFFDFSSDEICKNIEDEFMFGPDILVAPVLHQGATSRQVYLPAETSWTNAWTDQKINGGQWINAEAPIERIPVYLRGDLQLPIKG